MAPGIYGTLTWLYFWPMISTVDTLNYDLLFTLNWYKNSPRTVIIIMLSIHIVFIVIDGSMNLYSILPMTIDSPVLIRLACI